MWLGKCRLINATLSDVLGVIDPLSERQASCSSVRGVKTNCIPMYNYSGIYTNFCPSHWPSWLTFRNLNSVSESSQTDLKFIWLCQYAPVSHSSLSSISVPRVLLFFFLYSLFLVVIPCWLPLFQYIARSRRCASVRPWFLGVFGSRLPRIWFSYRIF